ncbi:MAG: hypothetical protein ACK5KU_03975 [Beutenbergiaceae bacterium]
MQSGSRARRIASIGLASAAGIALLASSAVVATAAPEETLTPQEPARTGNTLTIPRIDGVIYSDGNGDALYPAGTEIEITEQYVYNEEHRTICVAALPGYAFEGYPQDMPSETCWDYWFLDGQTEVVTPEPPTFLEFDAELGCVYSDKYSYGVRTSIDPPFGDSWLAVEGIGFAVADGSSVTVTKTPEAGFEFSGETPTIWRLDCNADSPPAPYHPQMQGRPQGWTDPFQIAIPNAEAYDYYIDEAIVEGFAELSPGDTVVVEAYHTGNSRRPVKSWTFSLPAAASPPTVNFQLSCDGTRVVDIADDGNGVAPVRQTEEGNATILTTFATAEGTAIYPALLGDSSLWRLESGTTAGLGYGSAVMAVIDWDKVECTGEEQATVTALAPTLTGTTVTIPEVTGVRYLDSDSNQELVGTVELSAGQTLNIRAQAQPGYVLAPGATSWAMTAAQAGRTLQVVVTPSVFEPGDEITVQVSGAEPGLVATVELHSRPVLLGTATVSNGGSVELRVIVPLEVQYGQHHVVVTAGDRRGETPVRVGRDYPERVTDRDAAGPRLPRTGVQPLGLLAVAGVFGLLGTALTRARRTARR